MWPFLIIFSNEKKPNETKEEYEQRLTQERWIIRVVLLGLGLYILLQAIKPFILQFSNEVFHFIMGLF